MWRMVLVAAAVGVVYALVPQWSDAPALRRSVDTFGEPWTLPELVTRLERSGVSLELEVAPDVDDESDLVPPRLAELVPGPLLKGQIVTAHGQIAEMPATVYVYRTTIRRRLSWQDKSGVLVSSPYFGSGIPEIHDWAADNVVVILAAFTAPEESVATLEAALLAMRLD